MYLTEDILKIIYEIPESQDISDVVADYLMNIYLAALEAVSIYETKYKPESSDFLENQVYFTKELQEEEPNLDSLETYLTEMRKDKNYNEIFEKYLDDINSNIVEEGLKSNPGIDPILEEYLKSLKDSLMDEYFNRLLKRAV